MMRRTLVLIGLLVLVSGFLCALEVQKGRMRLVLHEETGRFSLYYLQNINEKAFLPLFWDEDPRTSVMSIVVGNKIHRIGESYEFKGTSEATLNGARFVWTSNELEIIEQFTPIASRGAPLEDGVTLNITIENISERDLNVGLRYLFDTYLGEDEYVHFQTDEAEQLARETTVAKEEMIAYWLSPLPTSEEQVGLQCVIAERGITVPDRIVFANWKRLNDTTWTYEASSARNFNNPPYSWNDSAVVHYYDPKTLPKGAKREIVVVLGNYRAEGYSLFKEEEQQQESITVLLEQAATAAKEISDQETSDLYFSVLADLATVNRLLETIESALVVTEEISEDDLAIIDKVLAALKERAAEYSESEN